MSINGLDVSNNNGAVLWHTVHDAGYDFAMIKRSEGVRDSSGAMFTDAFFPANWASTQAVGMGRAAYHFNRPSVNPGAEGGTVEADFFCNLVLTQPQYQGDCAASDFEDELVAPGVDLAPHLLAFLQRCELRLGYKPFIYGGLWYLTNHNIIGNPAFKDYGLWLSNPGGTLANTPVPAPWDFIAILQTSWNGSVPGINGKVDLDIFAGTLVQFQAYGFQVPTPVPTPTPTPTPPLTPDNNDFEELHRLVDAQPFDPAALVSYAERFIAA